MSGNFVKVMVGPSAHYHQLKSGQIKYQKSKPANPIWRILILDEVKNLMHSKAFACQPSADEIERVTMGILFADKLDHSGIVIPETVEKLCPGLQGKLMDLDVTVYRPAHGFASGSRAGREWEKILNNLSGDLHFFRESMASCEEISAACDNKLGVITTPLWRETRESLSTYEKIENLAKAITLLRGRDPEVGRQMRQNETFWAPLNKGKNVSPPEDVLTTLLSDQVYLFMQESEQGRRVWDVIQYLKKIRDAETTEQKLPLLQELGASVVLNRIAEIQRHQYYGYLSHLDFYLRDAQLRYLVSLGVKEALKMLIVLENGLLQASAAKVTVHYPQNCTDLTLRGIPSHNHLEKMIQQLSGGRVAILPELASLRSGTPEFLQGWGPFSSLRFTGRTPFSPAQCLVPMAKTGSQREEGYLIVLAILPKDTTRYVPIEDNELATRMTALVNERLARNGKGVTCSVGPIQTYGDIMDVGRDTPVNEDDSPIVDISK
jgi:hypothetical protein